MDIVQDKQDIDRLHVEYTTKFNSEGAVVYIIYKNNASGNSIVGKIYKHKNNTYIISRAARELIKRKASYVLWQKRFREIHITLTLELTTYINKLLAFYGWLCDTKFKKNQKNWTEYIQKNFKELLKEFINLSGETTIKYYQTTDKYLSFEDRTAIMLVGIQGSGKTTLRQGLIHVLGNKVSYANQDELGIGKGKQFISLLKDTKNNLMIIDKCNHTSILRKAVYESFSKVYIIEFVLPNDDLLDFCTNRIKTRGICHPNLPYSANTSSILESFITSYDQIMDDEKEVNEYLALDLSKSKIENLKIVLELLKNNNLIDIETTFNELELNKYLQDYEKQMFNFAVNKVEYWRASVDIKELHHNITDYIESLRKVNDIKFRFNMEKPEYHITLAYLKNQEKKKTFNNAEKYNQLISDIYLPVIIESIEYDNKCAALRVKPSGRITEICENPIPHITIGVADGILPAQSSEMLTNPNRTIISCNFELHLIINPYIS